MKKCKALENFMQLSDFEIFSLKTASTKAPPGVPLRPNCTSLVILSVILFAVGMCALAIQKGSSNIDLIGKVIKVVDGDTLRIRVVRVFGSYKNVRPGDEKFVRLTGIDAPELDEVGGIKAKLFVESLCPEGTELRFDIDDGAHSWRGRSLDKYGRLLAVVYVKKEDGLVNLNAELVRENLAAIILDFESEFSPHDWLKSFVTN